MYVADVASHTCTHKFTIDQEHEVSDTTVDAMKAMAGNIKINLALTDKRRGRHRNVTAQPQTTLLVK